MYKLWPAFSASFCQPSGCLQAIFGNSPHLSERTTQHQRSESCVQSVGEHEAKFMLHSWWNAGLDITFLSSFPGRGHSWPQAALWVGGVRTSGQALPESGRLAEWVRTVLARRQRVGVRAPGGQQPSVGNAAAGLQREWLVSLSSVYWHCLYIIKKAPCSWFSDPSTCNACNTFDRATTHSSAPTWDTAPSEKAAVLSQDSCSVRTGASTCRSECCRSSQQGWSFEAV